MLVMNRIKCVINFIRHRRCRQIRHLRCRQIRHLRCRQIRHLRCRQIRHRIVVPLALMSTKSVCNDVAQ
jgi:hypothetical protein